MRSVKINNRKIGDDYPVYFIAEIGGNFKSFSEAKNLIDHCQKIGVDAIKLQTFKAKTHVSKHAFFDVPSVGTSEQFQLLESLELDEKTHRQIIQYCKKKKITVFSTPSHPTDVDFLEQLNVPAFKLGSDDATNLPLIEYVAKKRKPLILSTGMCIMKEVEEAVEVFFSTGNKQLILLHCVRYYPCERSEINLRVIEKMKRKFKIPVGYSDHTEEDISKFVPACVLAATCGANVIEKHVILTKKVDKNVYPDAVVSADINELDYMVNNIRSLEQSLGNGVKRPTKNELKTRKNDRKSLVAFTDIKKGVVITEKMLCAKRPGMGIAPKFKGRIIGKRTKINMKEDHIIRWQELG